MTLKDILIAIAGITGGRPPRLKIPHGAILPFAYLAEVWARATGGGEPFATIDGLRMAKKKMFFSHAKAHRELGYEARPAEHALADAVQWFRDHGHIG
jgi:dihydroflavonol-4-reductase